MGTEVSSPPLSRVLDRAAIGIAVSAAIALLALGPAAARVGPIEVLLALGILVVSPLAFAIVEPRGVGGALQAATRRAEPVAAAFAIASLVVRRGEVSGLLALPWAVLALAIAIPAIVDTGRERWLRLETLLPICGLAAQALAGIALVLWRARISPLDAGGPPAAAIAHLQFVGFGASVIASRLMRSGGRARALARIVGVGILAGVVLDVGVALGVTWLAAAQAAILGAIVILLATGSILWASAQGSNGGRGIATAASTLVVIAIVAATLGALIDRLGTDPRFAVASWLRVGAFATGIFVACDLLALTIASREPVRT